MRSKTFAQYILALLRPYRIGVPIALSIVVGMMVGLSVLFLRTTSDLNLIRAVAPHLSNLVETKERPEILRIVNSIAKERGADLIVVRMGDVYASSRSIFEMDFPIVREKSYFNVGPSQITKSAILTEVPIQRPGGPKTDATVIIQSPLWEIVKACLLISGFVLLLGAWGSHLFSMKIVSVVRRATVPLESLDRAIPELLLKRKPFLIEKSGITELDRMGSTVTETGLALAEATERAVEAQARERIADGYRRLIHDLYTPVAALRETIKIQNKKNGEQNEGRSHERVLRLAEQILNQVSVAKLNLGEEPKVLAQEDIRKCVRDGSEQAVLSLLNVKSVDVHYDIPAEPVVVPHDSEHMRRAVSNLVTNAIRASRTQVRVELLKSEQSVTIRVSDDGDGIEPSDVSLLLQGRKVMAHRSRHSYGLPSANHIARLHGGRIVYRQGDLGGACFELRI